MTGTLTDQRLQPPTRLLTRRNFLLAAASAGAGTALYSSEIARHEVSIVSLALSLPNLPDPFHNYRIAQISDIHFDEFTEPEFLARIVQQVNRLAPDLLLITGDFVSYGPLPLSFGQHAAYRCAAILRALTCPQRFAIMGNHDLAVSVPIVTDALAQIGIPVLSNAFVPIERGGRRLWLCGVTYPNYGPPSLHLAIPPRPDGPVLLMAHAPDFADLVVDHPRGHLVDLMFSGHSHGGQIRLPLIGPLILPTWGKKYVAGAYRFGRMQLYVNRGIGTVGVPFRLNCPPEITLFTLQPQPVALAVPRACAAPSGVPRQPKDLRFNPG